MSIWDRASESGTGRWHIRMRTPYNTVEFADIQSDSMEDAIAQAQAQNPSYTIEWAVREPNRYGVWAAPGATRQA